MLIHVQPVIDSEVRKLCVRPYPGHTSKKRPGCPNYYNRNRLTCPPQAPLLADVYDLFAPTFIVVNEFDLGAHVEKWANVHPDWTDRQLRNCLYWQGTARKQLRAKVALALVEVRSHWPALENKTGFSVEYVPEAMGVNVTATCAKVGVKLEWPPVRIARQVAFIGLKR